jgi:hypothetical protein
MYYIGNRVPFVGHYIGYLLVMYYIGNGVPFSNVSYREQGAF